MNASTNTYGLSVVGIIALALLGVGAFFVSTQHANAAALSVASFSAVNLSNETSVAISGACDSGTATVDLDVTDGTSDVSAPGISCVDDGNNVGNGTWTTNVDLSTLADGTITATVTQGVTASATATKDTIAPPAPVIDSSPSDPSHSLSFTSSFHDTEAGVTFQCALDADNFSDCSSGTFSGSTNAITHTARIEAVDAAGNTSETDFSWTISIAPVTTEPATDITASDAIMNGLIGTNAADPISFWVSQTSPIDTSTSNIPAGVYSTPATTSVSANTAFSDQLSLVTTQGITTGGVLANLPAITPNTTYYYVAWANIGGNWYPGAEQTVTTNPLSSDDSLSDLTVDGTTVTGFDPATLSYSVVLPQGTTAVPTVGVTTKDSNANAAVTQAIALPGSATVLVTAQDGTTNESYTVNFTVSAPVITAINPSTIHYNDSVDIIGTGFGDKTVTNGSTSDGSVVIIGASPSQGQYIVSWSDTDIKVDVNNSNILGPISLVVDSVDQVGSGRTESNAFPITLLAIDQAITVGTPAPSSAADNDTFNVAATSDSSLPVAITTSGGCSGTGSGSATITMTSGTNSCIVDYDQSGDAIHNPATEIVETVTASKDSQTIAFGTIADQLYADPDLALGATSDSGLPVSYQINGTGCTASSTPDYVVLENAGSCTVVASQSGDATYSAATPVTQIFNIDPRPITVTAIAASKTYDGTTVSTSTPEITSGSIAQNSEFFDTYELSQSYASAEAGSGITINPNIHFDSGAYTVSYVTATGDIAQAPLTITANDYSKTYDGTGQESNGVVATGFVNGENSTNLDGTFAMGGSSQGAVNVGTYDYVPGGWTSPNYDITYVNGTLTITTRSIEITADPQTKIYGAVDPALTYQVTGGSLVSGESLSGDLTRQAGESVDNYGIEQGTVTSANNSNYDISFVPATFAVTPAPLTITANDASKTVGDTLTFAGTEFTTSPLQNGETVGSVTLTSAGADSSATVAGSPYDIVPSVATGGTFAPSNYDITYTNGTLTVNAAPVPPAPSGGGGGNGPVSGGGGGGGSAPVALPNNGGATTTPSSSTGSPSGQVLGASAYNFTVNFGIGTKDNDVTQLQLILIAAGNLEITAPTGYFGQATFAAVKLYQSANGITPVSGYVGPKTRAVLNGGTIPTSADEQKSLMIQQLQQELQALMAQIAALSATTSAQY